MKSIVDVRNWHRDRATYIRAGMSTGSAPVHDKLADAIDAHLAKESGGGEAVGYASEDCDGDPVWSIATKEGIYSIVCAEGGGFQLLHTEGTKLKVVSKPFTLAQPKNEPAQPVEAVDGWVTIPYPATQAMADAWSRGGKFEKNGLFNPFAFKELIDAALAHPRPTAGTFADGFEACKALHAIAASEKPTPTGEQAWEVVAWAHRNDLGNVISARNKAEMERYEGMCGVAASVWDVPLYAAAPAPAKAGEPDA